jgi:hypothetical protein
VEAGKAMEHPPLDYSFRLSTRRRATKRALLVVLVVAVSFFVAGWILRWLVSPYMTDITDPARYQSLLADFGYPTPKSTSAAVPTIAHFPSTIPPTASTVRLYYRPHFMMGGTQLQLRFNLPAGQLAAIESAAQPLAKETHTGGEMFDAINNRTGNLPSAEFRNSANNGFAPLPPDFQVYVLDAKDLTPGTWNHGYSRGVAVSQKRSEVIYWLEDW